MSQIMDDQENSYGAPPTFATNSDHVATPPHRFAAFATSIVFGIVGTLFGFQLLVFFLFSTLIDPSITGRAWWRIYADRVLFNDGRWQIILVSTFLFVSIYAVSVSLLQLACTLFRKPTIQFSLVASSCFAGLATLMIVGILLFLRT